MFFLSGKKEEKKKSEETTKQHQNGLETANVKSENTVGEERKKDVLNS